MSTEDKAVGRRLEQIRSEKGLSQGFFAASLEVSLRTYQNYERGDRPVSKEFLCALIEKCDIDPRWVLTGKRTAHPPIKLETFNEIARAVSSEYSEYRGLNADLFSHHVAALYNSFADIEDTPTRRRKILAALLLHSSSPDDALIRHLEESELSKTPGGQEQLQALRAKLEEHAREMQALLSSEDRMRSAMENIWGGAGEDVTVARPTGTAISPEKFEKLVAPYIGVRDRASHKVRKGRKRKS